VQFGMIGLGRMGASMVRRAMKQGHECVAFNRHADVVARLASEGAVGALSYEELAANLRAPRVVWLMVPAAAVDSVLDDLLPHLSAGDVVVDGGNSWYRDDLRRARRLQDAGLHFADVGTSGGVYGQDRGYCLMVGAEPAIFERLKPIFESLAPGPGREPRTPGRAGEHADAERGFLHCGPSGAGHFVKMVHNGIEYGLMAAYAEGFNILRHAGIGGRDHAVDAETAPLRDAEAYSYDLDVAAIAELWRRGSVVGSWLLDLTAKALLQDPALKDFGGRVSDSGEGRWTIQAAIDEGVPAPVLSAALYDRFASRGAATFGHQVLSALRHEFGGHAEGPALPQS
jgi:6-phosphogluconate dehydrogenase